MQSPRVRIVRRDPAELTDSQMETLMQFGSEEAVVIDQWAAAVRAGDRELAWELGQLFVRIEDAALAESGR